jgi:hypothetical protein
MYGKPLLPLHREITKNEPFIWAGGQVCFFVNFPL